MLGVSSVTCRDVLAAVLHVLVIHSIGSNANVQMWLWCIKIDVRRRRRCKEKDDMLQISANGEDNNIG